MSSWILYSETFSGFVLGTVTTTGQENDRQVRNWGDELDSDDSVPKLMSDSFENTKRSYETIVSTNCSPLSPGTIQNSRINAHLHKCRIRRGTKR